MAVIETAAAIGLDTLAVVLLGRNTWVALSARKKPSSWPYAGLLGGLTVWALFSLISELPWTVPGTLLNSVGDFGNLGAAIAIPGLWMLYALTYSGRGNGLTRGRVLLLSGIGLPVLGAAFAIVAGVQPPLLERLIASMAGTEILYLFVLFSYSTAILVGLSRSHARVSGVQMGLLTAGVSVPYVMALAGAPQTPFNGLTLGLLAAGVIFAVAQRKYPVMTGFPKSDTIARSRVVESLREAVVVLDWDDIVLDANTTTAELIDHESAEMVGQRIQDLIPETEGSDLSKGTTAELAIQTAKGRRRFQYTVSAAEVTEITEDTDKDAEPIARTIVFRDVTDQRAREQRLTVLHRVLRHNVRNKLDVVRAYAEHVDDDELREGIQKSTDALLSTSNKARHAEQAMTEHTEAPTSTDLVAVANTIADSARSANPEADILVDAPPSLTLLSHRTVIEGILEELVENAISHSESSEPRVEIIVRDGEDCAAELAVVDSGPPIPERERTILETGTETQLEHRQGIGLWFVNWAVLQLGGDLEISDAEDGNAVTVRLYEPTGKE